MRCAGDVLKFLPDLSPNQADADLQWLFEHGYVERLPLCPTEKPHAQDTSGKDRDSSDKPVEQCACRAPAPAPTRKPTPKKLRTGTTAELTEVVKSRLKEETSSQAKVILTTSKNSGHSHQVLLDKDGNGETTLDGADHQHTVSKFCVMPTCKHFHEMLIPA